MARLRYQPATNPRGFQPIQLSSAGITRMQEENNRVIRNLESRRNAEISQRERNLQAVEQNQAAEANQRERNFQSEQQALKQQQARSEAAERFAIQNRKDPNEDLEKVITGLTDFSSTIGKISAERTKKMITDQTRLAQKQARDDFYNSPSAQTKYKNVQSLFPEETAKLDALTTEGVAKGEITTREASKDFFANPGRNAVYDQAYKNEALGLLYESNVQNLLQSTKVIPELGFAPSEASKDSAKMGLVTQYALETSLDKLGLSDKNPGYYQEGYEKSKKYQNALVKKATTAETESNYEKQAEQAAFLRTNLSTLGASIQSDFANPAISRKQAVTNFLSTISAVDPRTGEALFSMDDINNVFLPSYNQTVGQVFGGKGGKNPSQAFLEALRERQQSIRQFRTDEERDRNQNAKDFVRLVAIPQLQSLTDQESDKRDPLIFESFKALWPQRFPGISYPDVLIQAEQVAIAKNIEKEDNRFAIRAASTVPLTEQEIATIQNPATKSKYQAIFKEQQIKRFGPEFPKVLKSLKAKAISVAGFDPTVDGSINATSTFILSAMQKKVEEYALEGEKTGVKPEFISEYAVNKLNEYVAKGQTDTTNLFYKDPNSPDNAPNFPNLYGTAQTEQDRSDSNMINKLIAKYNGNLKKIINMPYALGGQDDYERISAQIEKNPVNVEYTPEIMRISRLTQQTNRPMSPREVYNASIAKVNAVSMRDPVIANEVNPVEDAVYQLAPEVQKLYNDVSNRTFNRNYRVGAEMNNNQGGSNGIPVRRPFDTSRRERALIDTIRSVEGTSGPQGYNTVYGGAVVPQLTQMTLGELYDAIKLGGTDAIPERLGGGKIPFKKDRYNSSASGALQVMPETLRGLVNSGNYTWDTVFSPETQDKMFLQLNREAGVDINNPDFNKVGQVWAGASPALGQTTRTASDTMSIYNQKLNQN